MKRLIAKMLGMYLETLALVSPSKAAREGFMLFCRPLKVAINKKQLAFFNTADKFTIDHEGYSVQGYRWGSGDKKILFIHGWQSHTYRWKPYIEALSKAEYTIYSLDAPGHGLSSGNFLTVPLYSSLIESFIREHNDMHAIVGHSLGSFSLLYTFYREPLLPVERLILLAPPGEASEFISVFQKTLGLSQRTTKLVIDYFSERFLLTPDSFSARKFAEHIKTKGLIIHDEDDPEAPYHYSILLQQSWEQSRLVTTKGYGHNLRSGFVVKQVVDFIQEPVHQKVPG